MAARTMPFCSNQKENRPIPLFIHNRLAATDERMPNGLGVLYPSLGDDAFSLAANYALLTPPVSSTQTTATRVYGLLGAIFVFRGKSVLGSHASERQCISL